MSNNSAAYQEALRRISSWEPGEYLDLALPDLTSNPESIVELSALTDLRLYMAETDDDERVEHRHAAIQSLSPLSSLTNFIGKGFVSDTGQWRCTDMGTRTITAIKISYVHVTLLADDGHMPSEVVNTEPFRFNGPPYADAESVFDEDSVIVCWAV